MSGLALTLDATLASTGGRVARAGATTSWERVGIDGRAARRGDLYVAIKGQTHDGHAFLAQAVAAGATGVIVERGRAPAEGELGGITVIEVDDGVAALSALGRWARRKSGARVVAITGSTGKTTTKTLIAAMLRAAVGDDAVLATEGSFNNETGVPLTLLGLRTTHTHAVIEMGMRGLGQIDDLCRIAEPDVGVLLNAGITHVGVVGSAAAIAAGKSEVFARLPATGRAIFPADDPRLAPLAIVRGVPADRHITFGDGADATVRVASATSRGERGWEATIEVRRGATVETLALVLPLVGRHNVGNAACALAVAVALELPLGACLTGLAAARPAKQRSELSTVAGRRTLVDCYNASPHSTTAALATLADLRASGAGRAVAVLGDMLELGDEETAAHAAIGRAAAAAGIDALITVGDRARHAADAARAAGVPRVEAYPPDAIADATARVLEWSSPGDWLLVKASRGMRLERVIDALEKA